MTKINDNKNNKISIVGIVGIPASYGGFETLVENLAIYNDNLLEKFNFNVYCSSKAYSKKISTYLSSKIHYIPLKANGIQSVPYDIISLISAVWNRSGTILLLGVSGAIALPIIRMISSAQIITNIDGIEWRRQKWKGFAKIYLRMCEKIAVRFSHKVISDNEVIAAYVRDTYGVDSHVITYGGDHALSIDAKPVGTNLPPNKYAFSVCRIEPENNVELIVEAFAKQKKIPLVLVGNWTGNNYGIKIRDRFENCKHIYLIDPIYDLGKLKTLRTNCMFYVHGHSAGGTNPSLVEAMHFGRPILAFDCNFNRATTENKADYFKNTIDLLRLIEKFGGHHSNYVANDLLEIARRRYTWRVIAREYFNLMGNT